MTRIVVAILTSVFLSSATLAEPPSLNKPLPGLLIEDRGEILLQNKKYSYRPWQYQSRSGEVHILQYFPGTQSASDTFKPLTDVLSETFPGGGYHVTTVINLDAAMWGTGGMVASKAKSSKEEFPLSTIVLDEDGAGEKGWALGEEGALLAVMDKSGSVIYVANTAMSEQELTATLALIGSALGS